MFQSKLRCRSNIQLIMYTCYAKLVQQVSGRVASMLYRVGQLYTTVMITSLGGDFIAHPS
jgi:hypothetical protein